jgi:hypothetical protein
MAAIDPLKILSLCERYAAQRHYNDSFALVETKFRQFDSIAL